MQNYLFSGYIAITVLFSQGMHSINISSDFIICLLKLPRLISPAVIAVNLHIGVVAGGILAAIDVERFGIRKRRRDGGENGISIPSDAETPARIGVNLDIPLVRILPAVHVEIIASVEVRADAVQAHSLYKNGPALLAQ